MYGYATPGAGIEGRVGGWSLAAERRLVRHWPPTLLKGVATAVGLLGGADAVGEGSLDQDVQEHVQEMARKMAIYEFPNEINGGWLRG